MSTRPSIVWFRQDLRLEDNPALTAAIEKGGPVIPVYIWAPDEEGKWAAGAATRWWLHYSLQSLQKNLPSLLILSGNNLECLSQLVEDSNADAIFWNRCYEPMAIARDTRIKAKMHQSGVEAKSFSGNLLFEPWTILNKQKKPFQVFTPFWKTCVGEGEPSPPLPAPKKIPCFEKNLHSISLETLNLLPAIPWDAEIKKCWSPGEAGAKKTLTQFLPKIDHYLDDRDSPDKVGISRLSPHLHFGEITPRIIWQAVRTSHCENGDGYLRQLGWREFAHHLLYHFPHTTDRPLRENFNSFPWQNDPTALDAWKKGLTGYPIVDAGMRELWATGWMHNRVRMVVGSFLVKDLMISWLEGAEWFWDTLVDADLANNTMGWQWVGGCGADAAPYFRIFNPITQGERFDPEGAYVRKWVPELLNVPQRWIHKPWEAPPLILRQSGITLGKDYPFPIVDHAEVRKAALAAFATLRSKNDLED